MARLVGLACPCSISHPPFFKPALHSALSSLSPQSEREALQWAAYEKQQKEIEKNQELIRRLAGGAQSGRAAGEGAGGVRCLMCGRKGEAARMMSHNILPK